LAHNHRDFYNLIEPLEEKIVRSIGRILSNRSDAELLARSIFELGYMDLRVFKGGYKAWIAAGLAIEREKS